MAEQEEAIKIVVEVVDKFTKPLRDLRSEIDKVDRTGTNIAKTKSGFEALGQSMIATATQIRGAVLPALSAVGVGVLSVTAAIGAMAAAVRGFAAQTQALGYLARETGVTTGRLR